MDYTLQPGLQSNYQVTVTLTPDELATYKTKALEHFQKEMKVEGFRPGHAPLQMVEQQVAPEYLNVALYEEALHEATKRMLQDHEDKKFIGTIYNLNIDDKQAGKVTLVFTIDVYPEVKEISQKRKKNNVQPLDTTASEAEIEDTIMNLKRQYADYQPAETVTENSVFKVNMKFLDKTGQEVNTGKLFLGKEDFEEFPQLREYFMNKKADEVVTIKYEEKKLPHTMHLHKEGMQAASIEATIGDIKEVTLPDFTPENIKKFFGNDDVTSEEQLRSKVSVLISTQKEESLLMQSIDNFLAEAMKSFDLKIPKTLIEEEVKTRMKSLQERMGGEEGMKQYFEKIGEEETKKLQQSIQDAAKGSLEKFLVLREIIEKLGIENVNREKHLDVEKALYAKLTSMDK